MLACTACQPEIAILRGLRGMPLVAQRDDCPFGLRLCPKATAFQVKSCRVDALLHCPKRVPTWLIARTLAFVL